MVQSPCRTGIREQAHPRTGKTEPRQAEADRDVHVCGETPDRLFRRAAEQKPRFGGHDQRFFRCGRDELRERRHLAEAAGMLHSGEGNGIKPHFPHGPDAVQPGDGSGRHMHRRTGRLHIAQQSGIKRKSADAQRHDGFSGGKASPHDIRHGGGTRGFNEQIACFDELLQA